MQPSSVINIMVKRIVGESTDAFYHNVYHRSRLSASYFFLSYDSQGQF